MVSKSIFSLLLLLAFSLSLFSQTIALDNASFEGEPQDATLPQGWFAVELGTTPDIMPGIWGVTRESSEGDTYIGLITREDGSFESIGQRLAAPFEKDMCYKFSLDLARSKTYAGYNFPIRLRIYAGTKKGKRSQLLWSSPTVDEEEWETHEVRFTAKKKYNYIIIEAYFGDGLLFHYNGNILVDGISPIQACKRA